MTKTSTNGVTAGATRTTRLRLAASGMRKKGRTYYTPDTRRGGRGVDLRTSAKVCRHQVFLLVNVRDVAAVCLFADHLQPTNPPNRGHQQQTSNP